jgi:hypothetical protein
VGSTEPPIQRVLEAFSSDVKRPVFESDYSPPSGAEDKKAWNYKSTLPYVFMALCLIKQTLHIHGAVLRATLHLLYHVLGRSFLFVGLRKMMNFITAA